MYNQDVANKLIELFGTERFKVYCLMEYTKNKFLYENTNPFEQPNEYDYEASWWQNKYEELIKTN